MLPVATEPARRVAWRPLDPAPFVSNEPEVRFLSKFAVFGLLLVRALLFALGLAAITAGIYTTLNPMLLYSRPEDVPPFGDIVARQVTFVCAGLPLALPIAWTFGRRRNVVRALLLLLVVGPMCFEQDPLSFLIRAFACFVGFAVILVWRTLWQLRTE